ncbi:MAG: hypothetical protein U0176_17035 [Bacteroidia bacterium]
MTRSAGLLHPPCHDENLTSMQIKLMSLVEMIDNALFVAKHDAMTMSLDYYRGTQDRQAERQPDLKGYTKAPRKKSTGQTLEEQYPKTTVTISAQGPRHWE